jgi:hypothetical protein
MNGRNYDTLLCRMTTIANRHEELKRQLEMMTNDEVQKIMNERRDRKISTRLDNYEEALKLNPLETPKVLSRRRPPEIIQKARELKWSAVAFEREVDHTGTVEEPKFAEVSSPQPQNDEDHSIARAGKPKKGAKSSSAAKGSQSLYGSKKSASPDFKTALPPLPTMHEETQQDDPLPHHSVDFERLHRTTAIESIRLQLQKEQLKQIKAKFDSIKAFPGYIPPPTVVYSNPDEQLQAPWRSKLLCPRPAREKKPWALPEPLRPRRKKKIVVEVAVEESKAEEVVVVAPVKSAMELMMMDMDDDDEDESDGNGAGAQPVNEDPLPHVEDANLGKADESQARTDEQQQVIESPQANQAPHPAAVEVPPQPQDEAERPSTSASALSEADSVFTRDSDIGLKKKAVVLTGEATHAIVMNELVGAIDFEDILLEKVLSGEEIHRICTQKGDKKPLRKGDLFLLGRFLRGDVMLVPESYAESDSSGNDDDDYAAPVAGPSSRGNSRGGPRSRDSKSRSRSRPSTQGGFGDAGFMMASDFVQVRTRLL